MVGMSGSLTAICLFSNANRFSPPARCGSKARWRIWNCCSYLASTVKLSSSDIAVTQRGEGRLSIVQIRVKAAVTLCAGQDEDIAVPARPGAGAETHAGPMS